MEILACFQGGSDRKAGSFGESGAVVGRLRNALLEGNTGAGSVEKDLIV